MAKVIIFYCDKCACEVVENHEARDESETNGSVITIDMETRGFKSEGNTIGMSGRKRNLLFCNYCVTIFVTKILELIDPQTAGE